MEPLQAAIAKIAGLPDLAPETRTLLDLAAQAQATGKMPKIPGLAALPAAPCPDCLDSGWAGDQGPGALYFRGRPTGNAEYVQCDCDPQGRAARNHHRRQLTPQPEHGHHAPTRAAAHELSRA